MGTGTAGRRKVLSSNDGFCGNIIRLVPVKENTFTYRYLLRGQCRTRERSPPVGNWGKSEWIKVVFSSDTWLTLLPSNVLRPDENLWANGSTSFGGGCVYPLITSLTTYRTKVSSLKGTKHHMPLSRKKYDSESGSQRCSSEHRLSVRFTEGRVL